LEQHLDDAGADDAGADDGDDDDDDSSTTTTTSGAPPAPRFVSSKSCFVIPCDLSRRYGPL